MATNAMVDAYLRQLLVEEYGEGLEVLEDGGYVVRVAGGAVRVWVVGGNHRSRRVLVMAQVLEEVDETPELLLALNGLNAATPYGRYFHLGDGVIVEDTVLAEELQPGALFNAIGFVAWAAENAHGFLVGDLGDLGGEGAEGPDHAPQPSRVELQDLIQPLGTPPTLATERATGGVVSAGGSCERSSGGR